MTTKNRRAVTSHWTNPVADKPDSTGERATDTVISPLEDSPPSAPDDALDDDSSVSNDEPDVGEKAAVAPEYGEAGPPAPISANLELEPVRGYRESLAIKRHVESQPVQGRRASVGTDGVETAAIRADVPALDAWYAQVIRPTDPTLLQDPAVAKTVAEVARTIAEVVIGEDDRVQIINTEDYPWRCVCALNITAADGSMWIGTGWLVGPRTVITAGHCVYIDSHGGWVSRIEVIPGCDGSQQPFGSSVATSFRSVRGWTQKQLRTHDYGAIILPDDTLGTQTGSFGFSNLSDADVSGLKVNLSGYPGDKPRGTQWYHARIVDGITDRTLVYSIDTAGGQSGAPVWRLRNGQRYVVGIHTNGDSAGNSATRITDPVFNNISRWKNEDI